MNSKLLNGIGGGPDSALLYSNLKIHAWLGCSGFARLGLRVRLGLTERQMGPLWRFLETQFGPSFAMIPQRWPWGVFNFVFGSVKSDPIFIKQFYPSKQHDTTKLESILSK
jgi:hypothetical protein